MNLSQYFFSEETLNLLHDDACLSCYSESILEYSWSISNYSGSIGQRC